MHEKLSRMEDYVHHLLSQAAELESRAMALRREAEEIMYQVEPSEFGNQMLEQADASCRQMLLASDQLKAQADAAKSWCDLVRAMILP